MAARGAVRAQAGRARRYVEPDGFRPGYGSGLPCRSARPRAAEGNVLDAGAAVWSEFGGVFGGAELDTGYVSYEYGLSNKELFARGAFGQHVVFHRHRRCHRRRLPNRPCLDRHVSSGGEDMVESVAAQMAGGFAGASSP